MHTPIRLDNVIFLSDVKGAAIAVKDINPQMG
jgi:hypothetical protein